MSSLAAARADNFYYPPEWTPEQGSINKFQKSHPLGKRAAKISEGILVIRFEMPYNCWCTGCSTHIGKGVRYNAEKKKVGAYFTTPIWQFTMPCYYCDTVFVIKTDPERRDYEFVSGVRRKVEEFEPEDNETYALKDDETRLRLEKEPIFKLETGEDDKRRAKTAKNAVIGVMAIQSRGKDDFELNSALRKQARLKRKAAADAAAAGAKIGLALPLLPEESSDAAAASRVSFKQDKWHRVEVAEKVSRAAIGSQSIFGPPSSSLFASSSTPSTLASTPAAVKKVKLGIAPVLATSDDKGRVVPATSTGSASSNTTVKPVVKLIPRLKPAEK